MTELLKMSITQAYNTILEKTTRMEIVVSDMEARLKTKELNPGSRSSDTKIVIGGLTTLRKCEIKVFFILQLITMSRVFDVVLVLYFQIMKKS